MTQNISGFHSPIVPSPTLSLDRSFWLPLCLCACLAFRFSDLVDAAKLKSIRDQFLWMVSGCPTWTVNLTQTPQSEQVKRYQLDVIFSNGDTYQTAFDVRKNEKPKLMVAIPREMIDNHREIISVKAAGIDENGCIIEGGIDDPDSLVQTDNDRGSSSTQDVERRSVGLHGKRLWSSRKTWVEMRPLLRALCLS